MEHQVRDRGVPTRNAGVQVELTEREVRALVRAATLVADILRPELFRSAGSPGEEVPLVTAYQVLVAACERAGVDLGLPATH
jgi:hypothetical protein